MTKNIIPGLYLISLLLLFPVLVSCNNDSDNPDDDNDTIVAPATPTPFDNVPALNDMVVYEVNFMAFGPSGTINDVLARIDSIKALGVNVLWLMPIHPEGELNGVGSPYSVQDYTAVNPNLGSLDDLKEFVTRAHELEMAVILDWVANHTAWDNDWIMNTDWYTQDQQGNIISPQGTGWNDVADLNFSNAAMRLEMIKSMQYWINTCNIDGFRCDAADMVPFDFWKQAIDSLKRLPGRDLILLAEGSRTDHYTAGFEMTYAWDFQTTMKNIFQNGVSAGSIYQTNTNEYSSLPDGVEKLRYITNHDIYAWVGPPTDQFMSAEGSLGAFVATAFLGGVPLICSGQEIAFPYTISFFEPNPLNWTQNLEISFKYKKVMQIRDSVSRVLSGSLASYNHNDALIFKRADSGMEVLIIVNVRSTVLNLTLPEDLKNTLWQNQWDLTNLNLETDIKLEPFEFILARRSI